MLPQKVKVSKVSNIELWWMLCMLIYVMRGQMIFEIYFEINQKIKWIDGWIENGWIYEWMDI